MGFTVGSGLGNNVGARVGSFRYVGLSVGTYVGDDVGANDASAP